MIPTKGGVKPLYNLLALIASVIVTNVFDCILVLIVSIGCDINVPVNPPNNPYEPHFLKEYGSFDFTFSPNGIGVGLKVYSNVAKVEKDFTDMDSW